MQLGWGEQHWKSFAFYFLVLFRSGVVMQTKHKNSKKKKQQHLQKGNALLFEHEGDGLDQGFTINEQFAKRFEEKKKKEELSQGRQIPSPPPARMIPQPAPKPNSPGDHQEDRGGAELRGLG